MKRILKAVSDTYITNRIIRDKFRATDANVGQAGTLDLFKLAGESNQSFVTASFVASGAFSLGNGPFTTLQSSSAEPIELSRILIKFDLDPIRALTSSVLNVNDSSFKCVLKLSDVLGGQPLPSNYSLILYPLSRSFDEGSGRDVYSFEDIDSANFITASVTSGIPVTWSQSEAQSQVLLGSGALAIVGGASHLGYVGQPLIDAMTGSTTLGNIFVVQSFANDTGDDLSMDVTRIVSATLAGLLPDCGYRISFSGTQETDDKTRFVKRFASRHSTNTRVRPKIEVSFNDSIQDNHENFLFNVSGSLFLNNFVRGVPTNITNPRTGLPVSGLNSMLLTLTSGSLAAGTLSQFFVTASQHQVGQNFVSGVYVATFALNSTRPYALRTELLNAHSATFTEAWGSFPSIRSGTFSDVLEGIFGGTPSGSFSGELIGTMSGDFQSGTGSFSSAVLTLGIGTTPFQGLLTGTLGARLHGTGTLSSGQLAGRYRGHLTGAMAGLFFGTGLFATGSATGSFSGSFVGDFFGDVTGTLYVPTVFTGAFTGTLDGATHGSYFGFASGTDGAFTASSLSGQLSGDFTGLFGGVLTGSSDGVFTGSISEGAIGFYTGSLVVFDFDRSAYSNVFDRLKINVTNIKGSFLGTERMRFRVFVQDDGFKMKTSRKPIESKSIIFDKMYYRIRDLNSNDVVFDFDTTTDSTRMSTDSQGMYFDVYMSDLDVGRVYGFDVMIDVHGSRQIFESVGGSFRIDV